MQGSWNLPIVVRLSRRSHTAALKESSSVLHHRHDNKDASCQAFKDLAKHVATTKYSSHFT